MHSMELARGVLTRGDLPAVIATYIETENTRDINTQMGLFELSAYVFDDGRDYRGLEAVRSWKLEVWEKFWYRIEPLRATRQDGIIFVEARIEGRFPGSPIDITLSFGMSRYERIASLIIF